MKHKFIFFTLSIITILQFSTGFSTGASSDYQDQILSYLHDGLTQPNNYSQNSYAPLYQYLKTQNGLPQFIKYQQMIKWQLKLEEQDSYRRITINPDHRKVELLPLYPILNGQTATIASFWDTNDQSFTVLPDYLRRFYQKMMLLTREKQKNHQIHFAEEHVEKVLADQLKREIPQLLAQNIWQVSAIERKKAIIEALACTTSIMYGQYHIELQLKPAIAKPLFSFSTGNDNETPRVMPLPTSRNKIPTVLANDQIFAVPVNAKGDLIYIGSIDNTYSQFDLLWDNTSKKIVYLDAALGYSLGNDQLVLSENYLLHFKNRVYIMRNSAAKTYSKVLYFTDQSMQDITHTDYMAPDL